MKEKTYVLMSKKEVEVKRCHKKGLQKNNISHEQEFVLVKTASRKVKLSKHKGDSRHGKAATDTAGSLENIKHVHAQANDGILHLAKASKIRPCEIRMTFLAIRLFSLQMSC